MGARIGEVSERLIALLQQLANDYNEEVYLFDSCEKLESIEYLPYGSLESQTTKERKKQSVRIIKPNREDIE
jgi:hypothetical protein